MNWYKKANLIEEIKKYGPNSPVLSIDDPRVEFVAEKNGISKDEAFNSLNKRLVGEFYKRDYFTSNYGWAVPDLKSLQQIKDFVGDGKVLEIGSGYGLWAKLLKDIGVNIIATDVLSDQEQKRYRPQDKTFTEVEDWNDFDSINKYGSKSDVLMLCWPPYDNPMATTALRGFGGNKLIYIGEGFSGCTANDDFFDLLEKQWTEVDDISLNKWEGIHDALYLYRRK